MHKIFRPRPNEYPYYTLNLASFAALPSLAYRRRMRQIAMQQQQPHIIIPSSFTQPMYHSKPTWKTIRTASRIGWLNMAEWLSVSCIDLDIGERSPKSFTCHPNVQLIFQQCCRWRSSPHKMIGCIFPHLCWELLTGLNEFQRCHSKVYKSEHRSSERSTGWGFLQTRACCQGHVCMSGCYSVKLGIKY